MGQPGSRNCENVKNHTASVENVTIYLTITK